MCFERSTDSRNKLHASIVADLQSLLPITLDYSSLQGVETADFSTLFEQNHYSEPEVVYDEDAWKIVSGGEYEGIELPDDLMFSTAESAVACVRLEAQALVRGAFWSYLSALSVTVNESIEDLLEEADEGGFDVIEVVIEPKTSDAVLGGMTSARGVVVGYPHHDGTLFCEIKLKGSFSV